MEKIKVKIYNDSKFENLVQGSTGASGYDLVSTKLYTIDPGTSKLIDTGIYLEIPEGYEGQVRSRSGLAGKNNVFCLNSPGTVDADYRGEIRVILYNAGESMFQVNPGMRVAQMVFAKVEHPQIEFVKRTSEFNKSERGTGGFGSTGL